MSQDEKTDCPIRLSALSCLVAVAQHHGLTLTPAQVIHENHLVDGDLDTAGIISCAEQAGLSACAVQLKWADLTQLKKALPVIITLRNGRRVLLRRVDGPPEDRRVVVHGGGAGPDVELKVDEIRFEQAWTGEVILIRRKYEITDETQPFSLGLIATLIFRERRMVRDVGICAFMLSMFALAPLLFWRILSDQVLTYKSMSTFAVICVMMGLFIAFEAVFSYLRRYLILRLTTNIDVKLADYMFEKVLNLPIDFFERTQIGKIAHDMSEMWRIRNFLTGQLFGTVLDSMTLFFFLPVMFFFSPTLTFIVLAICGLIVAWIVLMLPGYRKRNGAVIVAETDRGSLMYQTLAGIRTVKSLVLEPRQRNLWDVQSAKVARLKMIEGNFSNLIQTVVQPLERLMVSGTFALGVYFAISTNDTVMVGALFVFLLLSQRVAAPLMQMAQLINQYDEARSAVVTVAELVNRPGEEGRSGRGVQALLRGKVEFSNVRFTYLGANSPALDRVSFEVSEGTTLGIVGRSGSGKTTVTRLLQRLHSNYEGLIKIDGVDVREYELDHLRRKLGVVLQENFLFTGTIRENICAAKSNATFDEVVRAARLAGAEEFIDRLPRGYETHIYEGSPNLSGGQRQRLAIARALIVDPRILILDEATSALDPESEAIVNANISRMAQGRTVLVVSHRLSSLVNSDAILVLERGKVHDIGKHHELLERSEIYSELWFQQNQHAATAAANLKVGSPEHREPIRVA